MIFDNMRGDEDANEISKLIMGGVWGTTPVSQTPELCLVRWTVFELPDGDRHFVGYNITEHEGRVSSKIMQFDTETMRGVTSSGRVYELQGPPGMDSDALYVWGRWARINSVDEGTVKDVSESLVK
jgi:hypothetical protein